MAKPKQESEIQDKTESIEEIVVHETKESPWDDAIAAEKRKFQDFREQERQLEDLKPKIAKRNATSKPWQDNRRWKPDKFRLKQVHAGFWGRFINPSNVERRQSMGYEFAKRKDWGGLSERELGTGQGETSTIERDGMILMEIPISIKEKADEFQSLKTMNQTSAPTQWTEEMGGYRKPGHFGKGRWPTTKEGRIHAGLLRKSLTRREDE